jgi:Ser/Thr protein kinase RdoA (MazF antagonist)
VPALMLTVQPLLPGTRPEEPGEVAGEAGELLAALHAVAPNSLPVTSPSEHLLGAANSAGLVAVLQPTLAPRLARLLARLEETMPEEVRLVSTHGDFNARQLLLHRDELSLVDFDAMSAAPAAVDLATYAAYVVLGGGGDLDRAQAVLEDLLEGYGERPEALTWYLSTCILRRSPRPFRYLDEHWPARVESMVAASEAALDR